MSSPQTSYSHSIHTKSCSSTLWKQPSFWIGSSVALLGLALRGRTRLALLAAGGALLGVQSRTKSTFSSHGTLLLQCSPEEGFDFWRDAHNLPRFMRHVQSVQALGNGQSRLILRGPTGKQTETLVEIAEQRPSRIEWRSADGSSKGLLGRVEFLPAVGGRGTVVSATVQYPRAAVSAGYWMMRFIERNPTFLAMQDLRRFKALIETGEIPTTDGQPHGPRTWATAMARSLNPDQPTPSTSNKTVAISEQRRIA